MQKTLVAYFSASGVTARLAKKLAEAIGADLFEIRPETPYSDADLDWRDPNSRSSVEMREKSFRPAMAGECVDMAQYDRLFIGFPIWWYVAPTIVNTFLETCLQTCDLTGKKVIPFATSGSSGMGNTNAELRPSCGGATLCDGKRFAANASAEALQKWAEQF